MNQQTGTNILPDIVEYALSKNLNVRRDSLSEKQTFFVCPWCGDTLSKGKFKLTLNREKGLFRCFICHLNGGTLDFITTLEKKSREVVLKELRESAGINETNYQRNRARKHPAERLYTTQLKLIGFDSWPSSFQQLEPGHRKQSLDWVWSVWKGFLRKKQREALGHLMYGIKVDAYPMAIKKIKEMSQEIGHDLLIDAFEAYGSGDKPPKWASGVREWVEACYESYLNEIKESPGQSA